METLSDLEAATVMRQASMSTAEYMAYAIKEIDETFHKGYAAEHPELVGAFINASARDFAATTVAQRLEKVAYKLDDLARAVNQLPDHLFTVTVND
jgi:hypothetical protein